MSGGPTPVAVVGAGNMGANHARVYSELSATELVEVVEPDTERAAEVRSNHDVPVHESVADIREAKAASVAVPNDLHRPIATQCLEAGLDVLVEKPLAMTVADATAIVEVAHEENSVLQVGHIEQFNPAVEMLGNLINDQTVIAIEAHRLGPYNEHLSSESVVFDLMIHDLDVVESLVEGDLRSIAAFGTEARSATLDHAVAHLQFENSVLGTLTASHVTHSKVRELSVVTDELYITLDYQKQHIELQKTGSEEVTSLFGHGGFRTETVSESPYINRREPLKLELEHFASCVANRRTPRVDGEQGVRAVRRAQSVLDSLSVDGSCDEPPTQ